MATQADVRRIALSLPEVEAKVLAVRVANLTDKDLLIAAAPEKFFTQPHYNGFPGVP